MSTTNPMAGGDVTAITLTPDLLAHLRVLLFEDLHDQAAHLAKAARSAHEGGLADTHGLAGDDAESTWRACGIQETAALLYLIGWSTLGDRERFRREAGLRAVQASSDEQAP